MPVFYVLFNGLVIDQPDHPKRRVEIPPGTPLAVSAPTGQSAAFHAARVTRGEGVPLVAYDAAGTRVWGEGPDQWIVPDPTAPVLETPIGEQTMVFGA